MKPSRTEVQEEALKASPRQLDRAEERVAVVSSISLRGFWLQDELSRRRRSTGR